MVVEGCTESYKVVGSGIACLCLMSDCLVDSGIFEVERSSEESPDREIPEKCGAPRRVCGGDILPFWAAPVKVIGGVPIIIESG